MWGLKTDAGVKFLVIGRGVLLDSRMATWYMIRCIWLERNSKEW
jgi:hypothetical protein